jgi:hypothetical protein
MSVSAVQAEGEGVKDWKHIENCNFHGKWVRDMDRYELYALIDHLMTDANKQRSECVMLMNALCDKKARWRWLFG